MCLTQVESLTSRLLSGALVVSVFLYTVFIANLPLAHDEAVTFLEIVQRSYIDIINYEVGVLSNNHLLNSILIKFITGILGNSELAIRSPALLGHLLYLTGVYKITTHFVRKDIEFVALCLLVMHPFMVELFASARGYSLGLGFLSLSICCVLYSLNSNGLFSGKKNVTLALLFASLAVLANFSFFRAIAH